MSADVARTTVVQRAVLQTPVVQRAVGQTPVDPAAGWCELHCHTPFSMRGAGSSIEALVARASALAYPALAITDTMTLAGVVRFHAACRAAGIRPITGCELVVAHECGPDEDAWDGAGTPPLGTLIALARDRGGYAQLCGLLARANLACPARPVVPLADLAAHREGLALLVGGCDSLVWRPLLAGRPAAARAALARYAACLGADDLYLELRHERLPESGPLLARAAALARELAIPCVAAGGARYAVRADHAVYDLLTCVRLGIQVDEPHAERPRNAERHLKGVDELRPLFAAAPRALANAAALAGRCQVELLAERCVPPRVALPAGETPDEVLRARCLEGLPARYPEPAIRARAERQLEHELAVIGRLGLAEFFLVVWDIVRAGRARGIRCAGRGSAANSLVAYALGITAVDPIAHHLLFERFLNPERVGMPDIDVDVQSGRRDELIRYVEETYSEAHAAMVANVVTYRLRLAVRDVAKTLGFPIPLVDRMTRVLPHFGRCAEVERYAGDLARALAADTQGDTRAGEDAPGERVVVPMPSARWDERLRVLLDLVPRLEGMPRHLSLHNGGILLTRAPLTETLPVRLSANGVRAVELDKDDVERLGFIKFDLLGLRTFDAIETCRDLIAESEGTRPDVDALTLDPPDPATMELVRRGQTLAVFQIESPGQWHLLARTQPETFDDLVIQTALFRPGPVQAHMVHPYIARRQGRARVTYAHPVLEGVLGDTLGVVLFQEQVLEIAHRFAGLSYADADGFRRAMSHSRTAAEMEGMRAAFVAGAMANGIDHALADRVFGQLACFVGYGFCRSHAAAFAKTIYQTAWLKTHYPAHYLAAFLSSQPAGFFPPATVLEEAKHLGIPVLPVDVCQSADRFSVERLVDEPGAPYAIRIGLEQVKGVGEELARAILWTREDGGPYRSLADFCARVGSVVAPRREAVVALVAAGAFDALGIPRRRLLWLLGEHWRDWQTARPEMGRRRAAGRRDGVGARVAPPQTALPWEWPDEDAADAPRLPPLALEEEVAWDLATQGLSARPHPLTFRRRWLASLGVRPIGRLAEMEAGRHVIVAGRVVSAQRPPTAKGMAFLVLEDETGRVQAALPPALADDLRLVLAESRLVAIAGRVERARWHCSLLARQVRPLPAAAETRRPAVGVDERTGDGRVGDGRVGASGAATTGACEFAAQPA